MSGRFPFVSAAIVFGISTCYAAPIFERIAVGEPQAEYSKLNDVLRPYMDETAVAELGPALIQTYYLIGQAPWVKNVCKSGLYAGHAAMLLLTANLKATVFAYDSQPQPYTNDVAAFLEKEFPGRFFFSSQPIESFSQEHPNTNCDLMILGGPHGEAAVDVVKTQLDMMQYVANPLHHYVLLDDAACQAPWCLPREKAWKEAIGIGQIFQQGVVENGMSGIDIGMFRPLPAAPAPANGEDKPVAPAPADGEDKYTAPAPASGENKLVELAHFLQKSVSKLEPR